MSEVNGSTNRVMMLGGGEGVECEVCVDWMRLSICRNINILDVF